MTKFVICNAIKGQYLTEINYANTKRGFMAEFVMGDWRKAFQFDTKAKAEAVARVMWPIGSNQPSPYSIEEFDADLATTNFPRVRGNCPPSRMHDRSFNIINTLRQ